MHLRMVHLTLAGSKWHNDFSINWISEDITDLDDVPDILNVLGSFSQQFDRLTVNFGKHHNEE